MVSRLTAVVFFGAILICVVDSTAIAGARILNITNDSQISAAIQIDETISSIQGMHDDINVIGRNAPLVINVDKGNELAKNIRSGEVGLIKSSVTDVGIIGISDLCISNVIHKSIVDISEGSIVANIGVDDIQNGYISLERVRSNAGVIKNRQIVGSIEDIAISQSVTRENSEKLIAQIDAGIIQDNSAIEGKVIQEIANQDIISVSPKAVLIV